MSEKDFTPPNTISVNPVRKPYALQRAESGSTGIINTAATQQLYRRTAGWAMQHIQRATSLMSRYSSADSNNAAQDSLLLSVPVILSNDNKDSLNGESIISNPKTLRDKSSFSDSPANSVSSVEIANNPASTSLTTRVQRRISQPGLINSQTTPAVAREFSAVTNGSEVQQRLMARASVITPQTRVAPALNSHRENLQKGSEGLITKPITTNMLNRLINTTLPTAAKASAKPSESIQTTSDIGKTTQATPAHKESQFSSNVESHSTTSMTIARMPQSDSITNSPSFPLNVNKMSKPVENQVSPAVLTRTIETPVLKQAKPELQLKELGDSSTFSPSNPQNANTTHSSTIASQVVESAPLQKTTVQTSNAINSDLPLNIIARKSEATTSKSENVSATIPATQQGSENSIVNSMQQNSAIDVNQSHTVLRTSEIPAPVTAELSTLVWRRADNSNRQSVSSAAENGSQNSTIMRTVHSAGSARSSTSPIAIDEVSADLSEINRPSQFTRLPDLNRLAEQVSRIIARQLKIERERRGGTPWN